MVPGVNVPLKARSVGENLSLTFSLVFGQLPQLLLIGILMFLPLTLYTMYLVTPGAAGDPGSMLVGLLGVQVLQLICTMVGSAAALLLIAGRFTGERQSLGACLAIAFKRFFGLLGVSMVSGLLIGLGMLLLIIPGLYLATMFYVAVAVLLVERLGVFDSLSRSRHLVSGDGMSVFGFFFLLALLTIVLSAVLEFIVSGLGVTSGGAGGGLASAGLSLLGTAVIQMPALVGPAVIYFDLKVKKEGFDVAALADIVARIGRERADD